MPCNLQSFLSFLHNTHHTCSLNNDRNSQKPYSCWRQGCVEHFNATKPVINNLIHTSDLGTFHNTNDPSHLFKITQSNKILNLYYTFLTKVWKLQLQPKRYHNKNWYFSVIVIPLCSSRKYPYSPHRGDWNFLGGGRFCKAKKFKETYEA